MKNKIMIKQIPYILIAIFLIIQGCKDSGVDVIPVKDPRTYTWTADTLAYPGSVQTLMYDIWGSSPKDVYAVGHNNRSLGVMWHYEGSKWTDVELNYPFQGGNIAGAISVEAIYGISANNIYAVGYHISNSNVHTSMVLHYNGTVWTEENLPSLGGWLNTVYGTSGSNVWAGGQDALYHFNGSKWTRDSILVSVPIGGIFQYNSINSANGNFFAIGYTDNRKGVLGQYFFKEQSSKFMSVDSFQITNPGSIIKFGNTLWASKNGTLYSVGHKGVYKYTGSSWVNIFQTTYFLSGIFGIDDNNIFVVGHFGQAYHFNGADWLDITPKLNKDTGTLYQAVWTEGTEAFILEIPLTGFPQKTVVWHGK